MENLVRKNLSSKVLGAPMKSHRKAVGQATHSLPSLAPKASRTPLCVFGCVENEKQPHTNLAKMRKEKSVATKSGRKNGAPPAKFFQTLVDLPKALMH